MFTENLSTWNPGNFVAWLMGMIILVVLVERSLAVPFTTKGWKAVENKLDVWRGQDNMDLKPWICMGYCIALTFVMNIDFFSFLFQKQFHWFTKITTGLFIAGGSQGLVKFLKGLSKVRKAVQDAKILDPLGSIKTKSDIVDLKP